jgi:excinuclease ABC subunit C
MYNNRVNDVLQSKLKTLPNSSGVYFHKDKKGEIIYIGKAAILKNRVKQYFQSSRDMDIKTLALVSEIADTDWVETESEIDALFLEAEMVKRYMPRYNILLRDDKSLMYVRIDMKNEWPYVGFTRNPIDDGADYFGPYYNGFAVKKALRYLRRIFPYYAKQPVLKTKKSRLDLDDHLGLSPVGMTSEQYKASLRRLIGYIKGNRKTIVADLEKDMKAAAGKYDFETATIIRNRICSLRELQRRIVFGDKEFLDINKDEALRDLVNILGLTKTPARIEGYDISHMSGTNVVASMVVFKNGASDRSEYRKFKTRVERNDDFSNMNEILTRRLSDKNIKSWGRPDLILIDGGKGQLDAALQARDRLGWQAIPMIGLAKRDEQIVLKNNSSLLKPNLVKLHMNIEVTDDFILINLPKSSPLIKLLQRIRDESHRFAVSYHTVLKRAKQTTSLLDDIPGIGPKTRSKLIRKFGSIKGLKSATESDIALIIGMSKTQLVISYIKTV